MKSINPEVFQFEFVFDSATTTFDLVSVAEAKPQISVPSLKSRYENHDDEVTLEKLRRASIGSCNFKSSDGRVSKPVYLTIAFDDPGAALACARRDLEIRLKELAQAESVVGLANKSITDVLSELLKVKRLNSSQVNVLLNINGQLNKASHGAPCHKDCAIWLRKDWVEILTSLKSI